MPNPWFKFYGAEYLSDAKMDRYTAAERGVWLTILCMASVSNTPGVIVNTNNDRILVRTGVLQSDPEWDYLKNVLSKFESDEMISVNEETIEVTNWNDRQSAYKTWGEKKSKYRKNKKEDKSRTTVLKMSPIEEDKEEDKEEDNTNTLSLPKKGVRAEKELQFKLFWDTYPKKRSKAPAYRAWMKALSGKEPPSPEEIIESVKSHVARDEQWLKDGGQFIPNPATFLNAHGWEDELPALTKAKDITKY